MNTTRLMTLAAHLRHGKLGHEKFSFDVFNVTAIANTCGTLGCAIGELPIVDPKRWRFLDLSTVRLTKPSGVNPYGSSALGDATKYFGISHNAALHLFVPNSQNPRHYGGVPLGANATKEQVAENIVDFVTKTLAEQLAKRKVGE